MVVFFISVGGAGCSFFSAQKDKQKENLSAFEKKVRTITSDKAKCEDIKKKHASLCGYEKDRGSCVFDFAEKIQEAVKLIESVPRWSNEHAEAQEQYMELENPTRGEVLALSILLGKECGPLRELTLFGSIFKTYKEQEFDVDVSSIKKLLFKRTMEP